MSTERSTQRRWFSVSDDSLLTILEHMIWPILAIVIIGVLATVPGTLSTFTSVRLILWSAVPIGLLVLAESICLLSGHFDLSIGAVAGFSAMFTAMVIGNAPQDWNVVHNAWIGFALVISVGLLIGFVNGYMVGVVGINPFLQTLSFLIIFQGARTAINTQPGSGLPHLFVQPGGTPDFAIGVFLLAFVLFGIVMRYTRFGQAVYATGSDDHAAREVGVSTERVIIAVYAISGVLSAVAGLMIAGYTSVVPPLIGDGLVFQAFAGAVIGGISLFGGRGRVTGALGGVILIQIIQSALSNSNLVSSTQNQMINGIVLFVAILLYSTQDRIRSRILASD